MATVVIDNADFGEETKEQTHIMNMILLQNPSPTHDTRIQTTPLKRSLRKAVSAPIIEIDEYSMNKKVSPVFEPQNVLASESLTAPKPFGQALLEDFVYIMITFYSATQIMPDRTGYNTRRFEPCVTTNITYLPIRDASATEYSTIHHNEEGFKNERRNRYTIHHYGL